MAEFDTVVERLAQNSLWSFPGGVHPDDKKSLSNSQPISRPPLPDKLYLPLKQHIGSEGVCLVEVGQRVLKGQPLTSSNTPYAVPIHAPTSGTITAIGPHVSAHPSGLPEQSLVLEPDGLEEWIALTPHTDYSSLDRLNVIERLCDAGISGMGGAGFPTHIKTSSRKPTEFLIINGIECEPYITSDDRLMREHAWQIRQGSDILQHIVQPKHIIVAIEDNKPQALEAMRIAYKNTPNCSVVSVPTVYPAGGEKQLIQVLTGREVPRDGLPEDIGTMMFNVGTCYAIADAIFHGKPLIERVVTLTGEAAQAQQNVWALIGTPVKHLAEFAQLQSSKRNPAKIIMGGPMMGFTVTDEAVPVVKTTNCLLMPRPNEFNQGENERPCIRCSACSDVCPASLLPQQLYWHSKAKEYDKAQDYNLFDCIECGACAYVCPSDIPLVQYYREAKSAIRNERDEKNKAEKAKARFESRKARLEDEKREREERHRKAAEARKAAQQRPAPATAESNTEKSPKSAAVAAAIARAKAKKQNDDSGTDGAKSKAAAAIARAKAKRDAEKVQQADAPAPDSAEDDKKARVAAAVARAKAKREAEKAHQADTPAPESTEDDKKARVAAAVARAKAKRDAEKAQQADTPEPATAEDDKKARVAASVARAKAKRDAEKAQLANTDKSPQDGQE